jgi:hypothetical protein
MNKKPKEAANLLCEYRNVTADSPYDLLRSYLEERSANPAVREAIAALESDKNWLRKFF